MLLIFKKTIILIITFLSLIATAVSVNAQEDKSLELRLSRNFGYSSGTGEIQGNFTLKISGPEELSRVVFFINDEVMGEVKQAPFELNFHTGSYPLGVYTLRAIGYTTDGRELHSNEQKREFVTAQEGWQTAGKIILPLLAVIVLIMLASFAIPVLTGKKTQVPLGAARNYGIVGGTICPKCGRPFGMHIWGFNLIAGKLDRCPHCGKWSLVRRFSPAALRQAELAENEIADDDHPSTPYKEDSLQRDLEDSRYQDL